jgi:hypothetical protein
MSKLKDSNFTITGINTVGLVSLLAYTVRTFNEVNSNIEGLKQDLENIKKNNVENNRRSNIALTHLNEKINQNMRIIGSVSPAKKKIVKKEKPVYVHQETQMEEDPIIELGNTDEISGALSELLAS